MKKSTKGFLNNLITYAIVIIAFVFTQMALSKMIPGVTISRSLKGQLIPICVYIVMAVSLNLTVGISGELSLGHAGFMSVGAFSGIIMSAFASLCLPRYASMTTGLFWISSAVPLAMIRP